MGWRRERRVRGHHHTTHEHVRASQQHREGSRGGAKTRTARGPHLRGGLWVQAWSLQKVAGHCLRGEPCRLRSAVCATGMRLAAARRAPRTGPGSNSRSCCPWHACMEAQTLPAAPAGIGRPPCRCGRPASWLLATQIYSAPSTPVLKVSGQDKRAATE